MTEQTPAQRMTEVAARSTPSSVLSLRKPTRLCGSSMFQDVLAVGESAESTRPHAAASLDASSSVPVLTVQYLHAERAPHMTGETRLRRGHWTAARSTNQSAGFAATRRLGRRPCRVRKLGRSFVRSFRGPRPWCGKEALDFGPGLGDRPVQIGARGAGRRGVKSGKVAGRLWAVGCGRALVIRAWAARFAGPVPCTGGNVGMRVRVQSQRERQAGGTPTCCMQIQSQGRAGLRAATNPTLAASDDEGVLNAELARHRSIDVVQKGQRARGAVQRPCVCVVPLFKWPAPPRSAL